MLISFSGIFFLTFKSPPFYSHLAGWQACAGLAIFESCRARRWIFLGALGVSAVKSSALLSLRATCYPQTRYENEKRQECNRLVLAREQKQSVIDTYRTHATDTGSPEVQIALLSERIGQLTDHFKTHQKDHGSRRGLLMLVSKRRRLLDYLKKYNSERYKTVISKLGIRK
jgi:small subunit ribosomal protein S15